MNFAILLTPKQFLLGILLFTGVSFIFMIPWIFGTTPSRLDKFPAKFEAVNEAYEAATADIEQKTKLAESAVLKTQIAPLTIAQDVRLTTTVQTTVQNILEHPAVGAHIKIRIHSRTMGSCIAKLDWKPRFDKPLAPGAATDLELQWQTLGVLALGTVVPNQSPACDANKINNLVGTHQISKIESLVSSYQISDARRGNQELTHQIGPTANDNLKQLDAKETLNSCATVIALIEENKFKEEDAVDFENHGYCFAKIGIRPQGETLRESLEKVREQQSQ